MTARVSLQNRKKTNARHRKFIAMLLSFVLVMSGFTPATVAIATSTEDEPTTIETTQKDVQTDNPSTTSINKEVNTTTSETPSTPTVTEPAGSAPSAGIIENTEVVIPTTIENATIKTDDEAVKIEEKKITVPADKDFKFSVVPDEGYALNAESVVLVNGMIKTVLANVDNVYTAEKTDIVNGVELNVTAVAGDTQEEDAVVSEDNDETSEPEIAMMAALNPIGQYKVTFDANGGSGSAPAQMTVDYFEAGEHPIANLPDQGSLQKEGSTFLGWSESKDANSVDSSNMADPARAIYKVGDSYAVTGNQTLYAVWSKPLTDKGTIAISVRNRDNNTPGKIPNEPAIHAEEVYTFLFTASHTGGKDKNSTSNNRPNQDLSYWFNTAHTTAGVDSVKATLSSNFYNEVNNCNNLSKNYPYEKDGYVKPVGTPLWDPNTQYVEWYVIKYQNVYGSTYWWLIDGVVRDKAKVNLTYDGNGAINSTAVPSSIQLQQGANATVSNAGNFKETDANGNGISGTWVDLTRPGYTFTGWNTQADGKGTPYAPGSTITVNANTTLYAQWAMDANKTKEVSYKVQHVINGKAIVENTYTAKVWVNANEELAVQEGSITPFDAKNDSRFKGYKYDSILPAMTTVGTIVKSGATIQLNYVKDESQTQQTQYTVNYTKGGVHDSKVTKFNKTWVLDNDPQIAISEEIAPANKFAGYKLDPKNPAYPAVNTKVPSGTEYTVNYIADFDNYDFAVDSINTKYDGIAKNLTVSGTIAGDTITFTDEAGNVINNAFTNAVANETVNVTVTRGGESKTKTTTVNIDKRNITVQADNNSKVYGENDPEFTYSITSEDKFVDADKQYVNIIVNRVNKGQEGAENAGSYEKVLVADITKTNSVIDTNYNITPDPGNFVIQKAGGNAVKAEKVVVTYDGTRYEPNVKAEKDGSTLWFVSGSVTTSDVPSYLDAGVYEGTVYASNPNYEDTVKVPFVVEIKQVTLSINQNESLTYNGFEQTFTVNAQPEGVVNNETLTYEASVSGKDVKDGGYPVAFDQEKDVWSVTKADGSDSTKNYTLAVEGTLTITQADVNVAADEKRMVYGEEVPALTVTLTGLQGNDAKDLIVYDLALQGSEAYTPGTYDITVDAVKSQGNYNVNTENNVLTVVPQSLVPGDPDNLGIQVAGPQDVMYNAEEQYELPMVTDKNGVELVEGEDYTLAYTEDVVNVGTVTITVEGIGNYTGSTDVAYQITPAPLSIYVGNATKVAGQDDPEFTGYTDGLLGSDELYNLQFVRLNNTENVGVHENAIGATYDNDPNYAITVYPGTLTIVAVPVVVPPTDGIVPGIGVGGGIGAAAGAIIPGDATPLAEPEEIAENENPLAAFDQPTCWVHILMFIGMIISFIYGAIVVLRRYGFIREIKQYEKEVSGSRSEEATASAYVMTV